MKADAFSQTFQHEFKPVSSFNHDQRIVGVGENNGDFTNYNLFLEVYLSRKVFMKLTRGDH